MVPDEQHEHPQLRMEMGGLNGNQMKSQIPHMAPLGWEHISLTGDYVWTLLDGLKGSFRPLRTGLSPFLRVV